MIKILTIVGARPQFVKAAALSREINKHSNISEIIVHTGQHFDKNMSDLFFEEMEIPRPKYNLNIHGLNHGAMTGQMLEGIEKIILIENPDYVLVYGDTNSTIAGALAAKKLHVKVVHVEAGLRSFNMRMPEEVNRILTDRISDVLFCSTDAAIDNLKREGFEYFNCKIVKSGDVMEDAALYYASSSDERSSIVQKLNLTPGEFVLATLHRAENTDQPENLKQIIDALNTISLEQTVVLPIHPRTSKIVNEMGLKLNFIITEPLGYFDMISMLKHCSMVVTDSGGLQKEAYFFRKYCITMREQTEWVELVENNYNILTGASTDKIKDAFNYFYKKPYPEVINLYGNGKASGVICKTLLDLNQ